MTRLCRTSLGHAVCLDETSQARLSVSSGDAATAALGVTRPSNAPGAAFSSSVRFTPAMTILLRALAAHDGLPSIEALIADMAEERAGAIGVRRLFKSVLTAEREASPRWPADHAPEKSGGVRSDARPSAGHSHNPESEEGPEGVPRGALRSPPLPP